MLGGWTALHFQGHREPGDNTNSQALCAVLDQQASEGIASLIADRSAIAEWKLDQALLQLRRARRNCRSGSEQVAYHDYASLNRNLALPTAATRAHTSMPGGSLRPIMSVNTGDH
jgi:hypothetical protein